jgi:acetoacetyl-CoA synthetase
VAQPEAFWTSLWDECGVLGERGTTVLENGDRMPGARWFPQAQLNYAENLLRPCDDTDALVFWGEDKSGVASRMASFTRRSRAARRPCRPPGSGRAIVSPPICRTCPRR